MAKSIPGSWAKLNLISTSDASQITNTLQMTILDLTLPSPAENLACDEALLSTAEASGSGEVIRFWESPVYFVVVGYADVVAANVQVDACRELGVPVLRRTTGGGTVVQGPGCLNYALVLPIVPAGPTRSISAANSFIMERHRQAIDSLLGPPSRQVQIEGHTDLTWRGLKFSGNAQRRLRRFLLFHGTFLLQFRLSLISDLLRHPPRQPAYRQHRPHTDFLTNLELQRESLTTQLQSVWLATGDYESLDRQMLANLVEQKYSLDNWNRRH